MDAVKSWMWQLILCLTRSKCVLDGSLSLDFSARAQFSKWSKATGHFPRRKDRKTTPLITLLVSLRPTFNGIYERSRKNATLCHSLCQLRKRKLKHRLSREGMTPVPTVISWPCTVCGVESNRASWLKLSSLKFNKLWFKNKFILAPFLNHGIGPNKVDSATQIPAFQTAGQLAVVLPLMRSNSVYCTDSTWCI